MLDYLLLILPFFYFRFMTSTTPGPNNVMLTASGMNFGYKQTIPHMAGIMVGSQIIMISCALGLAAFYQQFPQIDSILKILGSLYLIYLSYRVGTAGRIGLKKKTREAIKPISFTEAFLFQFVNPKALITSITAISILPTTLSLAQLITTVSFVTLINSVIAVNIWVLFGKMVAKLFRDDKTRHVINVILALLLLATIPMVMI